MSPVVEELVALVRRLATENCPTWDDVGITVRSKGETLFYLLVEPGGVKVLTRDELVRCPSADGQTP
jgi:hypothetical protein